MIKNRASSVIRRNVHLALRFVRDLHMLAAATPADQGKLVIFAQDLQGFSGGRTWAGWVRWDFALGTHSWATIAHGWHELCSQVQKILTQGAGTHLAHLTHLTHLVPVKQNRTHSHTQREFLWPRGRIRNVHMLATLHSCCSWYSNL